MSDIPTSNLETLEWLRKHNMAEYETRRKEIVSKVNFALCLAKVPETTKIDKKKKE